MGPPCLSPAACERGPSWVGLFPYEARLTSECDISFTCLAADSAALHASMHFSRVSPHFCSNFWRFASGIPLMIWSVSWVSCLVTNFTGLMQLLHHSQIFIKCLAFFLHLMGEHKPLIGVFDFIIDSSPHHLN